MTHPCFLRGPAPRCGWCFVFKERPYLQCRWHTLPCHLPAWLISWLDLFGKEEFMGQDEKEALDTFEQARQGWLHVTSADLEGRCRNVVPRNCDGSDKAFQITWTLRFGPWDWAGFRQTLSLDIGRPNGLLRHSKVSTNTQRQDALSFHGSKYITSRP